MIGRLGPVARLIRAQPARTRRGGAACRAGGDGCCLVGLALAFAPLPQRSAAEAATFEELYTRISRESSAARVKMAVAVIDLAYGERCGVNAKQSFQTASLYKLVVLAGAFQQRAAGTFTFNRPPRIEPKHAVDDAP